ncbi:MAG: type 1 glutamine amidotransferase [Rhodobacter sp.]|nr:type 1 glutamine amidotransferase [Rhodobacter sp.]
MQIGILTTGHVADSLIGDHGDYPFMFMALLDGYGFTFSSYAVVDLEFPASVHDADGWLITGSRHGAYDDLPFIAPLEQFIRDAYGARVPLVGICFGHQIIAQALGGRVEKFSGGWAVGATEYDFGDRKLMLNAWHQDQVTGLPPDARVSARNPFCENAALVYDDRAFSVQPHPEIRDDYMRGLLRKRGPGVVPDDILGTAETRIGTPLDDRIIARQIAEFFMKPRTNNV